MIGRVNEINWLSVGVFSLLLLSGCASNSPVQGMRDVQRETREQLQRQEQRIAEQERRLQFLESERQVLVDAVYTLQNALQLSQPQRSPAKTAESDDTPAAQPQPSLPKVGFNKVELGRREWVWFDLFGRSVEARIDPTVKSSIIYASSTQLFERDGDEWVRFGLLLDPPAGDVVGGAYFETPVVKRVRVKSNHSDETVTRAVVSLRLQLGELVDEAQFTVASAGDRPAGVVLGQSFLRDVAVVNPNEAFLQPKPVK